MRQIYIFLFLCITTIGFAQPANDNCNGAYFLPNIDNYCSDPGEFTNIGATADPPSPDLCLLNYSNGVWFAFQPQKLGVFIEVVGNENGVGTMENPAVALYAGSCSNLIYDNCSPGQTVGRAEFSVPDLIVGATYYLLVMGGGGNEGTFQLCMREFNPIPSPESDCPDAVVLCDKSPFFVENLGNEGLIPGEADGTCISGEKSSAWYKWTCDQSGTLEFTLTPNNFTPGTPSDDLDFVVYELINGIDNCSPRQLLRCMASGANQDAFGNLEDFNTWSQCSGPTGLLNGDPDIQEFGGCQGTNDNNFADAVDMESGKSYAMVINNFSNSGLGFSIDFGGTGTFLGPEVDFDLVSLDNFECDKTVEVTNTSSSTTDMIVEYQWSFGQGSDLLISNDIGPHTIIYESFGQKKIALTVTTSRGCTVTKILDVFINPCCADTSNLAVQAVGTDLICAEDLDGLIQANGVNGNPEYSYSVDGINFSPISNFSNLGAGEYTIFIQDIKGCVNSVDVTIEAPLPFIIDAGEDMEVALGCSVQLGANYEPFSDQANVTWTQGTVLTCNDCLDPEATPFGTTMYVIEAINQNGCVTSDSLVVRTEADRSIFAPNVFSPLAGGGNDRFMVGAGKGSDLVEKIYVYDRWGELMWLGSNIPTNDFTQGWDGTFKGQDANIGVYTWLAKVHYIDDHVEIVTGDVTLIR